MTGAEAKGAGEGKRHAGCVGCSHRTREPLGSVVVNFAAEISIDLASPGSIPNQIWTGIRRAEVVVADITGNNPNVFYELGLAHALGKEVILIAQGAERAPFDVSTWRMLRYEVNDVAALGKNLRAAFSALSPRYAYEGSQPRF